MSVSEREVIFSIQVNDDGEWVEKLVDTPEALASLKRLHNMERVATTRPTEGKSLLFHLMHLLMFPLLISNAIITTRV